MRKSLSAILAVMAFAVLSTACSQQADIGITTRVKSLLGSDRSVTNAAQIQVTTKNNVVTLAGAVDTPATKKHAVTVARAAEGVKNVVDNLTVAPGPVAAEQPAVAPAPVAESQPAVAPVPVAKAQPAVAPVLVTKAQPAVVPAPVAKAQPAVAPVPVAESQPAVAPIPIAEAKPTVAPVPVAETKPAAVEAAPGTATAPTDAAITQAVKEKLLLQPETPSENVAVDTHEGVVTLSGTVKSLQDKEQVIQIARGTQGVQRVEDKLSVSSS
jgi:osmotically-inducible protein OsmY